MNDLSNAENFILRTLPEVRHIILKYYRSSYGVEIKQDETPVTIADREVEALIRAKIQQEFPSHGIIGEESGDYQPQAEYKWVIDPIDGTKSFVSNVPLFGTLIALMKDDRPVLGCLYLPVSDDLLIGNNTETKLNGQSIRMPDDTPLKDALLLTTDYKDFSKYKNRQGFDHLMTQCKMARTWGDCFGYYLLVTGKAHVMVDPAMSVWDKMALIPIVTGAGGRISDFYGNAAETGDSIVASVGSLHSEVIKILNETA